MKEEAELDEKGYIVLLWVVLMYVMLLDKNMDTLTGCSVEEDSGF